MLAPHQVTIANADQDAKQLAEIEAHIDRHLAYGVFPCHVPITPATWTLANEEAAARAYRAAGWLVAREAPHGHMMTLQHPDLGPGATAHIEASLRIAKLNGNIELHHMCMAAIAGDMVARSMLASAPYDKIDVSKWKAAIGGAPKGFQP